MSFLTHFFDLYIYLRQNNLPILRVLQLTSQKIKFFKVISKNMKLSIEREKIKKITCENEYINKRPPSLSELTPY